MENNHHAIKNGKPSISIRASYFLNGVYHLFRWGPSTNILWRSVNVIIHREMIRSLMVKSPEKNLWLRKHHVTGRLRNKSPNFWCLSKAIQDFENHWGFSFWRYSSTFFNSSLASQTYRVLGMGPEGVPCMPGMPRFWGDKALWIPLKDINHRSLSPLYL